MKSRLIVDGKPIKEVAVSLCFNKKRAPFKLFATVNLHAKVEWQNLSGQQAKLLLVLIFWTKASARLKEIALAVGVSTASARRSLRKLVALGLVEQPSHGKYRCSRSLRYFGLWKDAGKK
jgi:predicted MarR family transcription regulator